MISSSLLKTLCFYSVVAIVAIFAVYSIFIILVADRVGVVVNSGACWWFCICCCSCFDVEILL